MPKALTDKTLSVCFRPYVQTEADTVPFSHHMATEFTTNVQKLFQQHGKNVLFYILQAVKYGILLFF